MLITIDDLAGFGEPIDPDDQAAVAMAERMIKAASAAITDAAGTPIVEATSTVVLLGMEEKILDLPGLPIRDVQDVKIDGEALAESEYKVAGAGLWRYQGWARGIDLTEVEVTYTHGLPTVPEDIAALCASMALAGIYAARDGGWDMQNGNISSIRIDDYQEGRATGGEGVEQVTPMSLPARTREWLAVRFGAGARVLRTL